MQSDGRGMFVTLEGPDGSGKSIQSARLGARLLAAGLPVVVTREPGGTQLGERVRDIVLTHDLRPVPAAEALLFNAARAQHVAEVIEPALRNGSIVVCDRFADSTLAYQGTAAGQPLDVVATIVEFATGGLRPDLTILLDLPAEDGLRRKAGGREVTRFEAARDLEFHRRVREAFLGFVAAEPERFVVVDALLPPAEVEAAILAAVLRRLPAELAARVRAGDRELLDRMDSSEPQGVRARMDR